MNAFVVGMYKIQNSKKIGAYLLVRALILYPERLFVKSVNSFYPLLPHFLCSEEYFSEIDVCFVQFLLLSALLYI